MTEPLPVTLPCGCTVENQHVCRPPFADEEIAWPEWHDEVCS